MQVRIWPARFTTPENLDGGENEGEYQGCYLVGLRNQNQHPETRPEMSDSERRSARVALQNVLNKFADQIRGDENYFDPTSCWVDATLARCREVGGLCVDNRDWAGEMDAEAEPDSDDELVDEVNNEAKQTSYGQLPPSTHSLEESSASKSAVKVTATATVVVNKLRPAGDILNRLRWDPHLSSNDYVIGYEDRFFGVRETPIDRWKLEQTHEEFIPQHRIVYFKRKSDGHLVWDRISKRDEIFGSGVGKE